jgi:hypothetical protein
MDQGNGPCLMQTSMSLSRFWSMPNRTRRRALAPVSSNALRDDAAPSPLDREGAPLTLRELAQFPQIYIQDGPALELFSGLYRHQGLTPRQAMVTNISTAAQALVGTSDCVSLRIVRPAHPWSPSTNWPLPRLPIHMPPLRSRFRHCAPGTGANRPK